MNRVKLIALVIVLVALAALATSWIQRDDSSIRTFTIEREDYQQTIDARGHVDTRKYVPLRAPDSPYSRQVVYLVTPGQPLPEGTVVARFDGRDVEKKIEKLTDELSVHEATILEKKNEWTTRYEGLSNMIMKLSEESKMTEISLSNMQFDSKLKQDEARVSHSGVLRTLKSLRHYHERFEFWERGEIDHLTNAAMECQERIDENQELLEAYVLRAPFDTLARYPEIRSRRIRRRVELGDDLSRLQEFGQLPDYDSKCVDLLIPEKQLESIAVGMPIEFHTLSNPHTTLQGVVASKSNVASIRHSRPGQPLYRVRTDIDPSHTDDPSLAIGANVRAKIIVARHSGVFLLPGDLLDDPKAELRIFNERGTPVPLPTSALQTIPDYYLLPAGKSHTLTVNVRAL